MKHYLASCYKILFKNNSFGRLSLFINYLVLIARSFVAHRLGKQSKEIHAGIAGFKVKAFSFPQLINLFEEIFIYEVYYSSSDIAPKIIIDCGSNIGMSLLYFKKRYPQSNVIAFEPDAASFELLQLNIDNNGLASVDAHQVALSNIESQSTLFRQSSHSGSLTMSLFSSNDKTEKTSVITKKLSTYITSEIDLLKIDVEGSESLILRDLIDNDKLHFIKQLIIEFHPSIAGQTIESFVTMLSDRKFSCSLQKDTIHPGATEFMVRAIRM